MKKNLNFVYFFTIALLIYSLFAFTSIKTIGAPIVDEIRGNNIIYLIAFILLIRLIFIKKRKTNLRIFLCILLLLLYSTITVIFNYNSQSIYSICILFLPILFLSTCNVQEGRKFKRFLKTITIISIIYSIFVCTEFFFYDFFTSHFSINKVASYVTRHSTMLGTSITTSYYFILNIPFEVMASQILEDKWKKYAYVSIFLNVIAIIINQSRICFITLGIYFVYYFIHYNKKVKIKYKVLIIVLISILMIWVLNNSSLNRLYTNYGESVSTQTRINVLKIGIDEFKTHPAFGSGLATYYKRLWKINEKTIRINDYISLIDPHNIYIYILVEQGIIGFAIFFSFIFILKHEYIKNLPKEIISNLWILLIGKLIVFCGGSQLLNEINYSIIFWIYFMFVFSYSMYIGSEKL